MRSMTGYGKGAAELDGRKLSFEIKTVNNRYLEIALRVPKSMMSCDEIVRRCIQSRIKRGSVDVFFSYENNATLSTVVKHNLELARQFVAIAEELSDTLKLRNDFDTYALMRTPEVITVEAGKDDEQAFAIIAKQAMERALDALDIMRVTEGEAIKSDLASILELMEADVRRIAERWPQMLDEHRQKLSQRITELLGTVELDQERLISEVAFLADKADLNEEIQRLTSHFEQFRDCLNSSEAVGRKLDFISQEMNREINTIGSKSVDIAITNIVLSLKTNLEKIKEQIRNVE